jgi:hypothetical protein
VNVDAVRRRNTIEYALERVDALPVQPERSGHPDTVEPRTAANLIDVLAVALHRVSGVRLLFRDTAKTDDITDELAVLPDFDRATVFLVGSDDRIPKPLIVVLVIRGQCRPNRAVPRDVVPARDDALKIIDQVPRIVRAFAIHHRILSHLNLHPHKVDCARDKSRRRHRNRNADRRRSVRSNRRRWSRRNRNSRWLLVENAVEQARKKLDRKLRAMLCDLLHSLLHDVVDSAVDRVVDRVRLLRIRLRLCAHISIS